MTRSAYARLRVVLDTILGRDHPTSHKMDTVVRAFMNQET